MIKAKPRFNTVDVKLEVPKEFDLRQTRLIQRLNSPFNKSLNKNPLGRMLADNPFSFGGGYKNGGLSDTAMHILREIWEFDYMGAAEFEYGAVPEALSKMGKGDLVYRALQVEIGYTRSVFEDEDKAPGTIIVGTVYIIAPKELMEYATWVVKVQASSDWPDHKVMHLKESSMLNRGIRWKKSKTVGWLELDHGFFFTVDEEMAKKFAGILEVKTDGE